ncbi:glutamate-cysteine ligase family protein [Nocardioides marmorisolisilvae]|nr:glutamate-cysteine ligase family protein [Nocardioides marmorisolisilvae]
MNRTPILEAVAPLFARTGRSTRVAIEQELFAMDVFGGASVAPKRVLEAVAGRDYARWVTFEPGGQVELSLPPAETPAAAAAQLARVTDALADDLMAHGIAICARPVRGQDPNTPRHLLSPRYDAMERHLDSIGAAGRRMMRSTASTQVCLDWWAGREGLEQWRVLNLAGPFLAAATAKATGPQSRLATWLEVDPSRTAFDDRLLHGRDPVAAYADFAAGARVFVDGGVADHLTTLFPPVRPRGSYLEVRFPDARPAAQVEALVEGFAGLLYDDERRRSALAVLAGEQDRLAEHWAAAAVGTLDLELGAWLLGGDRRAVAA